MSALDASKQQPPASAPSAVSPRLAWTNLTSVSGAHAAIHATVALLPLIYPILHAQYGFSYTEIGLLTSIPSLIGGLLQVAAGYLGRYVARKVLIGLGNLIVGVSVFFTALVPVFPNFLGWSILRNIGSSPQHPIGAAMLSDTFRKRHGFALTAHVVGGNIGTLLVPTLGTLLIVRLGWQPTLMLFALPGLVAGSAVLLFAREPRPAEVATPYQRTADAPSPRTSTPTSRWRELFAPLRHRSILLIILASAIAAGGRGVGILTTYIPLYLRSDLRLSANLVAILYTLLLVGSVIGPLVAGHLSDRTGRRPLLLLSYGCAALFMLLLPLIAGGKLPLAALFVEIVLLGLAAYAESPLLQAYLADHISPRERDIAFGWYFTIAVGFGSQWGAIIGTIIDATKSFPIAFFVMAGSYVLAALVLLGVPRLRPNA